MPFESPGDATVVAGLEILVGVVATTVGGLGLAAGTSGWLLALAAAVGALGILFLSAGVGTLERKPWARDLGLALGIIGLAYNAAGLPLEGTNAVQVIDGTVGALLDFCIVYGLTRKVVVSYFKSGSEAPVGTP